MKYSEEYQKFQEMLLGFLERDPDIKQAILDIIEEDQNKKDKQEASAWT